ncbi:CTHRC1 [Branchiostoma lanceolatum]|uniref:CTHRC1 protein n=1 Tax=Branchiostoma lanceolatum TaxID=7740 RepID=A0A8K0EU58_BRALA|nr:CTHRC1 [Branchiostoma lanceolatum]
MAIYSCFAVTVVVLAMLTQKSHSQDVRTGQCCGSCVSGPQGSPGIPGNNGLPGNHGVPGNIGAPGRDGAKGDQGEQGLIGGEGAKGDRGEQGQTGGDGAKGDRGEQGQTGGDGAKGDRGEQGPPGEKGETGSPSAPTRYKVKQCVWNNLDNGVDSGKIMDCQFHKVSSTTALRLTWNGTIRYAGSTGGCARWFFTVNGTECADPAPIDGVVYTPGVNIHRVSTIDGLCYNLPAGSLDVGRCAGLSYLVGDANTGFNSYSRMILEELDMSAD